MAEQPEIRELRERGAAIEVDAKSPDRPVIRIRLDGPHITDRELKCLEGMTHLHTVDLFDTRVTDDGLRHLSGLTNIKWLDLESPHVTDSGLLHLRGLTNLHTLLLTCQHVTKTGVKDLERELPQVRIGCGK